MKVFYQISTHWDREWYKPFQGFRYELVNNVEKIMQALEENKINVFTFDGQTIVLDDYLEIKPEQKDRLIALIREQKLKIGPWYVMPDELLVSGESIIRNFLLGKKLSNHYGTKPWNYGYLNDIFGHIAQMPQILNGFDIKGAYLGRGVGDKTQNYNNFLWKSPDGSSVVAYKQSYSEMLRKYVPSDDKDAVISEYINKASEEPVALLNYTDDHASPDENTFDFQKRMELLHNEYEVCEGFENVAEAVIQSGYNLPCETGELIATAHNEKVLRAVTHSISSWYPLKQENDKCEQLLENKISSLLVLASAKKVEISSAFFEIAYKYLLKNQPHDSICGCSIDRVHTDMFYRYSQVYSIAEAISEDFMFKIGDHQFGTDCFTLSVLNYEPRIRNGVFITDICFDKNWQCKVTDNAGYQSINSFEILDCKGRTVTYQILDIVNDYVVSEHQKNTKVDKYTVAIDAELFALGITNFRVVPKLNKNGYINSLSDGEMMAENEYVKMMINHDGTITLIDKETGTIYENLDLYVDDGEAGNGWFHEAPCVRNNTIISNGAHTMIENVYRGELVTKFRTTKYMEIPQGLDYAKGVRKEQTVVMKIVTDITLMAGSHEVEFETKVFNNATDHRLRVEFRTGLSGDNYYASQAFCFVNRKRGISPEKAKYREPEAYEKNTGGIVVVKDDLGNSLSFIGKEGLHECAVSENGVIACTLFRGFGRILVMANEPKFCQLEGQLDFKYAISTEKNMTKLIESKKKMMNKYDAAVVTDDTLQCSLVNVESDSIAVSIVGKSENGKGIILRVYNPTDSVAEGTIVFGIEPQNVKFVTLEENKKEECVVNDNKLPIRLQPYKIETIYFEM